MADGTKGTPFCFVSTKMQFKPHEVYSCTHTKGQNFLGKEGGAILVRLLQQEGSRPPAPLGVGHCMATLEISLAPSSCTHVPAP